VERLGETIAGTGGVDSGSKVLVDERHAAHPVLADLPSKQWWEWGMEEEGRGGKKEGREEIYCMDHDEKSWGYRSHTNEWKVRDGGRISNPHNCVELRNAGGRNIPIGWVAPTLHQNLLPFAPNPLGTSRQERRQLLQEWAVNSPPTTGTTGKICQTTYHKWRKRRGRGEEVVKRYEKSILGKSRTT